MKTASSTPPAGAEPLPLWRVLVYGLGAFAGLAGTGVNSLSLPIFNIVLGVDAALITTAMGIVQMTGLVLDPVIANISDSVVTRLGRRKPFLIGGSVVAGLAFAVLWLFPTGWSDSQYFVWYLALSLVLNLGNSLYGAGYFALGIEIATDYADRTRVMAIRSYFSKISALVGPWLFFLAQLGIFSSALTGAKWIGALIGAVVVGTALPCALFTRERIVAPERTAIRRSHKPWQAVAGFFQTIASVGNNRYFWMVLGVSITLASGLAIFEQIGSYVNIFYVFKGDTKMGAQFGGWSNTLGVVLSILAIPLAQSLCGKFGKHVVLRLALGWMLVGSILKWWCYTPANPYLILVIPFFYSVGISSFWMLIPAMQADVVDTDELHSGKRREAMFGAVQSLGFRLSGALAIILMGIILKATGFKNELGGEQSEDTFFWMRFLYSFAMAGVILLSFAFLAHYDLTARRMEEIRMRLERMRMERR